MLYRHYYYKLLILFSVNTLIGLEPYNAAMTIFVHGTIKPPEISFSDLIKILKDKIDNTIYSRVILEMRKDQDLCEGQIMQGLGLIPINEKSHLAVQALKKIYEYQLTLLNKNSTQQLFYTFGWDGLLSWSKRYKQSEFFYEELHKEIKRLSHLGIKPFIRIITFSHGGNVALNLSIVKERETKKRDHNLIVDELIMLAVPVQAETDQQIASDFFKKIYHCYSMEDSIQTMDFFSSQRLWSKRFFTSSHEYKVPESVTQIRLRITKHISGFKHAKTLDERLGRFLNARRLKHKNPTHTEMFHFQWATNWYRKNFPLRPLPIVALIPTIIHTITAHTSNHKHIIFDYHPETPGALLKNYVNRSSKKVVTFLEPQAHEILWNIAQQGKPENFSLEKQKNKMIEALKKAQEYLESTKTFKKPKNRALANYFEWAQSNSFYELPQFKKFRKIHLLSAQI